MKGAKIVLHAKSPTYRAAKLKGFTVVSHCFVGQSFYWTAISWCPTAITKYGHPTHAQVS